MDTSSSELWDQVLTQKFQVQGESSCRKLISIFEEANIEYFDMEASFMEEYQLSQFEEEWDLQNNSDDAAEYKGMRQKKRYYLQRPHDYPFEEIMQIGDDPIRGVVFMQIYRGELERMKQDYEIRISTNGMRLYIFMRRKESLNIMCKNSLLDMNRSLRIFYGHEPSLIFIVNASFMLRKQLQEKGINVWFKRVYGRRLAVFFSVTLEIKEMLPIIQEITQCDISVFDFQHVSMSESEAMSVKEIVESALRDDVLFLKEEYEMAIEFSKDNCFIVFHTKHAIFGDEPVTIFQERLNNLLILSVKSCNIKEFDNKIRKLIKKTPFVYEQMNKKRNETFMAIDLSKIHTSTPKREVPKQLQEYLKLFILLIEPKFELKFYFNHMKGDIEKCFRRVIDLIENHNLIIKNHSFYDFADRKVVIQLKDLSENVLPKRQKELLQYLNAMISLASNEDRDAVSILDEATLDNLGSITNVNSVLNSSRGQDSLIEERFEVPWLKMHYAPPTQKKLEIEQEDYAKDRKERVLIDLFNAHSEFKFQVWNIHLSSALTIPTHNISPRPYLFKQMFNHKKINDGCQRATFASFQLKQQGAIGFMTNEIAMPVIPLFLFQRIH